MQNHKTTIKAALLFSTGLFASQSLAGVASGITYNNSVNCDAGKATPDEEGVIYGTDDTNRQWLNIYEASGSGSKPVFLYAHANGGSACNVNGSMKGIITGEGYTIVSWASHPSLSNPTQTQEAWSDAQTVIDYLRINAASFNLDMSNVIVAGRSRGSGASWKLAHSGDSSIQGMYMPQALPDPFWEYPTIWDPAADVTANSKPIYMPYKPSSPDISNDIHDPRRGLDIVDRYTALGIGDTASVAMGIAENNLFDYFPMFLDSLDMTTPPSPVGFSDDFSDSALDPSYTIFNGDWSDRGFGVLENSDSRVSGIIVNGDANLTDYTVSARLKTRNQRAAGTNWEVARVVARMSDSDNYYEAFVKTNGNLFVKSIVDGSSTNLLNTEVGIDPLKWYDLSLSLQSSQIEVSVNGASIAVISDTSHTSGQAGVKAQFCECRFDNLVIAPF